MIEMRRYEIPVDDQVHQVELTRPPLAVAAKRLQVGQYVVEFWAEFDSQAEPVPHRFRVLGTGHLIPPGAQWAGTCDRLDGLVWHLYRLGAP